MPNADYALDWQAKRRRRIYSIRFEFKKQDCWIGLYWKGSYVGDRRDPERRQSVRSTEIWLCIVPMLPLHIRIAYEPRLAQNDSSEGGA